MARLESGTSATIVGQWGDPNSATVSDSADEIGCPRLVQGTGASKGIQWGDHNSAGLIVPLFPNSADEIA